MPKSLLISVTLLLALSGCGKDSYVGFYYPNGNNLYHDIMSQSHFDSLNECRGWVNQQKAIHNPDRSTYDDYECGLNCDLSNGKPYLCEKTLE
jgi:hypothetical protein